MKLCDCVFLDFRSGAKMVSLYYCNKALKGVFHPTHNSASTVELCVYELTTLLIKKAKTNTKPLKLTDCMVL